VNTTPLDTQWRSASFSIINVKQGRTYGVCLKGGNSNVAALVLADAQVTHRLPIGRPLALQNHAGQYHSGGRVFLHANADEMIIRNSRRLPFSIRDAATWRLLYASPLPVPQDTVHPIGKDRRIAIILASSRNWLTVLAGVQPWVSAARESWFVPDG
jgi:hypothetical protein